VQAATTKAVADNPGTLDQSKLADTIQKGFDAGAVDAALRVQEAELLKQKATLAEIERRRAEEKLKLESAQVAAEKARLEAEKVKMEALQAQAKLTEFNAKKAAFEVISAAKYAEFNLKAESEKKPFCVAWKAQPMSFELPESSSSYMSLKALCVIEIAKPDPTVSGGTSGTAGSGNGTNVSPTPTPTPATTSSGTSPNISPASAANSALTGLLNSKSFIDLTSAEKVAYCTALYKTGAVLASTNVHKENLQRCALSPAGTTNAAPLPVIPFLNSLITDSINPVQYPVFANIALNQKKIYCAALKFVGDLYVTPNNGDYHFGNKVPCSTIEMPL
jgi:hypothetical protein